MGVDTNLYTTGGTYTILVSAQLLTGDGEEPATPTSTASPSPSQRPQKLVSFGAHEDRDISKFKVYIYPKIGVIFQIWYCSAMINFDLLTPCFVQETYKCYQAKIRHIDHY